MWKLPSCQLSWFAIPVFFSLRLLFFRISVHQHLPEGGGSNQGSISPLCGGRLHFTHACQVVFIRGQSDFEILLTTLVIPRQFSLQTVGASA